MTPKGQCMPQQQVSPSINEEVSLSPFGEAAGLVCDYVTAAFSPWENNYVTEFK